MAPEARYTEQMPFVGTPAQRFMIEKRSAAGPHRQSFANAVRKALDSHFGLIDGELPEDSPLHEEFLAWQRARSAV